MLQHTWSDQDIQALAENAVRRLMNYLSAEKVDELSSQERVGFALMTGESSKRLSLRKEELGQANGRLRARLKPIKKPRRSKSNFIHKYCA